MQSPIDNLQSSINNAPLPPSTGIDTIQQNPTKSNGNSCVRARGTAFPTGTRALGAPQSTIPNPQFPRQESPECGEMRRKLVCARTHEAQRSRRVQERSVPPIDNPQSTINNSPPPTSFPHPPTSFPRRRESPNRQSTIRNHQSPSTLSTSFPYLPTSFPLPSRVTFPHPPPSLPHPPTSFPRRRESPN